MQIPKELLIKKTMKKINIILLSLITALTAQAQVKVGIEVLRDQNFAPLKGKRIGLITNPTGVDSKMQSTVDILHKAEDVQLVALFAPEHGVRGDIAAGAMVSGTKDATTGVTVFSLYGNGYKPKPEMLKDVDALVFDIQDIGSRSYTFISTMGMAMEAAAENGKEFVVLDRPNPLGGLKVEGSGVSQGFSSFVSKYNIPYIHGMTVGELAKLLNEEGLLRNKVKCKLTVVPMTGWGRDMDWSDCGLAWIPTSPHIPSWESAYYYPITGMIGELSSLQIGIGYTLPFQTFAAEWIDKAERLATSLNRIGLKGVLFRAIHYKPFYGSNTGKDIHGVHIHITDINASQLTLIPFYVVQELVKLYPSRSPFASAKEDRLNMFDKVMGNSAVRKAFVAAGCKVSAIESVWDIKGTWFLPKRKKYLVY